MHASEVCINMFTYMCVYMYMYMYKYVYICSGHFFLHAA